MSLTDTHCHLNHADFDTDRQQVLARARASGIERLLVVGYDLPSSRSAISLAKDEPDIQAVVGIHPESGSEWSEETRSQIVSLIRQAPSRVAAWGEIGLDYHWESVPRQRQQAVFEEQIAAARAAGLPIVIHCRDAYADTLAILRVAGSPPAVLHCFTGTRDEASKALDLGCYLGFGGVLTFKKSADLREVARNAPLDRLLLETDSPYLAPQPWRGKRNEPSYLTEVARVLAEVKGLTAEETARITADNADVLFGALPK